MTRAEDVAALEASAPWDVPAFRAGLSALSSSTAAEARQLAADAHVLTALAGQVPRCPGDERGGTPWTSFRQEVAVARAISGQAAAAEIRLALRLTSVLPHTLHLLETGQLTATRARVLVQELEPYDDELAGQLDADLADLAAHLAPWRIAQHVRRAVLTLDPDAAADRTARATATRDVTFTPSTDGQACVLINGPAVPLTRWYSTLDARARALRTAGDPRTLANLRFDLTTSSYPCANHPPADPTTDSSSTDSSAGGSSTDSSSTSSGADRGSADSSGSAAGGGDGARGAPAVRGCDVGDTAGGAGETSQDTSQEVSQDAQRAAAGLRLTGVEAAATDCRMSRPVQAVIVIPVETALGLSNEPAWLDGYGWLDAPSSRLLLLDAELRRACTHTSSGQLLDLTDRDVRPPPTPDGVRSTLLDMITGEIELSDTAWRTEPAHDPTPQQRTFTCLRDRTCDGPTQPRTPADRCDLDHTRPHPHGPTAAWNLAARNRRTHQLKHYGWTPVRTATSTLWTSPAGQLVTVPRPSQPAPGIDPDPTGTPPALPDPSQLTATDTAALTATPDDELPPVLPPPPTTPGSTPTPTTWTYLEGSHDAPF